MRISTHLQSIKAPTGRHSDARTKGLYLLVNGTNRRWVYRYTKPSTGRVTELGLGGLDVLSLQEAREAAEAHRRALKREGTDPVEAKREAKALRARTAFSTFGALAADYISEKQSGWSASSVYSVRLLLERHASALANKPITAISPDDVVDALKHLRQQSPEQERRALAVVSRVFDYAMARELCDRNPAMWRGRMQMRYPKLNGQRHFTALPYKEVPELVRELRAAQSTALSASALEFLLLTACRVSEVANMRWEEIEDDVWTIPAERMKAGKEHRVPLSNRAMQLLIAAGHTARSDKSRSGYVWPGRRPGAPLSDRSLYMFLTVVMRYKDQATLHGLRRTFRDWCGNETDFARENIEECLAHQVGSSVERAYRRGDALEKRRVIMQSWSDYCSG